MKKYLTLFFTLVGLATIVNGQTFKTFSDDFESYKNGAWLSQAPSSPWETWSGTPITSGDDVKVTNSDAYSGKNSIYFNAGPGPEDVVLDFGGLYERGQFVYKSMMKIPTGKSAYFNFQGAIAIGTSWAVEVHFESTGALVFDNTSSTMLQTSYPQGRWFELKVYINLTRNEWNVYIDDDYLGTFSNSINAISFLDIYPEDLNASYWVDDASFIYAPASPDNAGVEALTSPLNAVCGKNEVKVRLVNNGTNVMDSVRVYWMLDGVLQSPVFVKTAVDTGLSTKGHELEVTLNSALNLSKGVHTIKAWTAFPNGVADTLNFDDTLHTSFKAEIRDVNLVRASPFQGKMGKGTLAWPDTVCVGDTLTYGVTPPSGYKNSDLGTGWAIKYLNIQNNSLPPVDSQTIMPVGNANFRLRYVADSSEGDSIFKIDISVSVGTGGCDTVLTRYFYVNPQPHTAFTAAEACVGKGVFFSNKSKGAGSNKYVWDFGDNTTSKLMSTSKPYFNPGTYTVTLKATAPSGCSATAIQNVTIHDIPVSKFSVVDACDSSSVVFSDSSSVATGSITKYYWEFGDGDTSNVQNPTHIYKNPGTYKVRFLVTSDQGCIKASNQETVVHPVPNATFSTNNGCQPDTVVFSNTTSYTGTDSLTYEWDFSDGNQSTAKNPAYLYGSPGNYWVKMKVKTAEGCMDSTQVSVEIYAVPVADFTMTNNCLGDSTGFTNNSSIGSGSITDFEWNFHNGRKSTVKDIFHKYGKPGIFSVELIVTGTGGCMDTTTKDVEVYPVPQAEFTLANVCQDVEVVYDNQSTTTSDTLKYQWNFGDDNTSIAQSPKNIYTKDGTYNVQLLVNTENGCMDSIEKSIEIYPLPEAGFSFIHKGFKQHDFTPTDTSLLTYDWDFGDGNTSTDVSPYHEYATEGNFDVTLSTTDSNSCASEKTIEVSVSTGIAQGDHPTSPFKVFPNPFRNEVNIAYQLQKAGNVTIEVYSLNGKRLTGLVNQKQSKGEYQYKFDTPEASGIYMLRMVVDGYVYHERIVKAQ